MLDNLLGVGKSFCLNVGDEGAVLIYYDGKAVAGRFFFANPDNDEFKRLLLSEPQAPVHILVDTIDQSYVQHTLPPVSSMNVKSLVQRRLDKDFEKDDIKGARLIRRDKEGRKEWHYLFVSVPNAPPFSEWADAVLSCPNPLAGIYMLPVETEAFLKDLQKQVIVENISDEKAEWQLLTCLNKVGGLRQVVYHRGKVVFTRMTQPVGGMSPGVLAGTIEQETSNVIEFLRRLDYDESDGIDMFIIASAELKRELAGVELSARNSYIVTPHEMARQLGLANATEAKDRFSDVVLLTHFAKRRSKSMRLTLPIVEKMHKLSLMHKAARAAIYVMIPLFMVAGISMIIEIRELSSDISQRQLKLTELRTTLSSVEERNQRYDARKEEIYSAVYMHQLLSTDAVTPLNTLQKLASILDDNFLVRQLSVEVEDSQSLSESSARVASPVDTSATIEYIARNQSTPDVLRAMNQFEERVVNAFSDKQIRLTGLPTQRGLQFSEEASLRESLDLSNITLQISEVLEGRPFESDQNQARAAPPIFPRSGRPTSLPDRQRQP